LRACRGEAAAWSLIRRNAVAVEFDQEDEGKIADVLHDLLEAGLVHLLADIAEDLSHHVINLLVGEYLLCLVHEQDINSALRWEEAFLFAVALAYPSLEEVTLHCAFEEFLGNRNHDAVYGSTCVLSHTVPHAGDISILSLGKKFIDVVLAVQPFFLRKGISYRKFHLFLCCEDFYGFGD